MKVLFWLNKRRANKIGLAPLMLRVTHHGTRTNVATGIRLTPKEWDSSRQKAKGGSEKTNEINDLLQTQASACLKALNEFISKGEAFSSSDIVNAISGEEKPEIGWLKLFDTYLANMESRIGVDFSKSTVIRYKSSKKNLKDFITKKLHKQDLNLSTIDRRTIVAFDQFLRGEMKFTNNYVIKTMEQVRKVFKQGVLMDYVSHNPFDLLSYKKSETNKDFLQADELARLQNWDTDNQKLSTTKDILLFMCYTGLAYADMRKAKITDITTDNQNRQWLILRRTKTNNLIQVPLLSIALETINKYDNHFSRTEKDYLLPVPCNQVLNRNIKELCTEIGIKKHICSHSGRYTFASTVLLGNGVRVEVAQKLLAHNSIKSTMIYSKLSAQAISGDIDNLERRL